MSDQRTIVSENAVNSAIVANPEKTAILRDEKGRWLPGVAPNPGGRPKSRHVTEELKARLESGDAEVIGSQLIEMAKDKSDKWLALAATKEVVDRTEGKAMTRAIVGHTVDPNALARLNELAEKLGL